MHNPYQAPETSSTATMRPCVGCNKDLHLTAAVCPHCGANQRSKRYKSKTAAALLAFFLGQVGAHRFYLGQWWGIFYLLFFWTLIPGFIALVEFIVFLVTDQQKWDNKYNEGRPAGPADKGGAGAVVAVIIGVFLFISIIGILAAIALPAYQDYTYRAKVTQAIMETRPIRDAVEKYANQHEMLPDSNIMLGIDEPYVTSEGHTIQINNEVVILEFGDKAQMIAGETLLYVPMLSDSGVTWNCTGGSLPNRLRPATCRQVQ